MKPDLASLGCLGALNHQSELCIGCATCRYVCSPGAIKFLDQTIDGVTWGYISAQCTSCGKCVEHCPTKALSFEQNAPALADTVIAKLHKIKYQLGSCQPSNGCAAAMPLRR